MKKYLEFPLIMITVLLVSCAREGYYGPQGHGGWGSMMHYGFGYGGMLPYEDVSKKIEQKKWVRHKAAEENADGSGSGLNGSGEDQGGIS